MEEPTPEPEEPIELTPDERADIEADLHDLDAMRGLFAAQGVKGVVIACQDCGANHFYEWELLQDNLDHMLKTGEPRMHEPAFEIQEEEYIQWDYGKGYIENTRGLQELSNSCINLGFDSLKISSMDIKIITTLRRVITPITPMVNSSRLKIR